MKYFRDNLKFNPLFLFFIAISLFSCKPDPIDDNPNEDIDTTLTLDYLFDHEALPHYKLAITVAEWNKLLTYFDQNEHNEEYVNTAFTFEKTNNTVQFATTGLRLRGNTSRRRPEGVKGELHNSTNPDWHHASFTLKFNKFLKGQKLLGQEKMILKWFKDDAMYIREIYCYDLFRRFGVWTAPRSSYCRLTISVAGDAKPAYYGVYQSVESIDEDYIKHRKVQFGSTDGFLWKANYGADLSNADKNRMGLEIHTLSSNYDPVYDLKTNDIELESAKTLLAQFIDSVRILKDDAFKKWVTKRTDIDLLLKTYAVNVMCGMWDDYWKNKNNYYFYMDRSGKFWFIPYDYDNTLGTSLLMSNSGTQNLLSWGSSSNPLISKIISISEYRTKYINYLKELNTATNDLFYVDKSAARIIKWQTLISNHIINDTGEDMELKDVPASWGNCPQYRLLGATNNYFSIRGSNLPQ
jgi:spore coat protein CotH